MRSSYEHRRRLERLSGEQLRQFQLGRLNALLETILPQNKFYAEKLAGLETPLASYETIQELPLTEKDELLTADDFAANRTFPLENYVHLHRTSGTRGRPMIVLDTADDWQWWLDGWQFVFDSADVTERDRVMLAFSYGPFIGFWTAHDAAVQRGTMVLAGGGLQSLSRLDLLQSAAATVLCCTPTYALHLAEVAAQHGVDIASSTITRVVVCGEPGGSMPQIRERIERSWNAKLIDHAGATEVGPWGYAEAAGQGLYVNESEFIAEFHSMESGANSESGELSELVLTSLGRTGSPVIRYRTGDIVRPTWPVTGDCRFVMLEGGVLGRADDMMIIRGVNVFPTSVEKILRGFPEVVEYRLTAERAGEMDQLRIEVEDRLSRPDRIAMELQRKLGLKIQVDTVEVGALPRFEGKGKRFIDKRST